MSNFRSAIYDPSSWGCDLRGRDSSARQVSRRAFLRDGALALVGTSTIPAFLTRAVLAQARSAVGERKRLVVLFQRGAVDGLNVVVPFRDPAYAALRPTIALKPAEVLDLDGTFGLHPALTALRPLYDHGHLAIVHAVGSPDATRSHFDAQDFIESGTPGIKSTQDGWMNRALADERLPTRPSAFRALALGSEVPRSLQGSVPAIAINNVNDFSIAGQGGAGVPISSAFEALYDSSTDSLLHGTGRETFEAVRMLKAANPSQYKPAAGVVYPNVAFGNSFKSIAQLIKADLGVEAAFADIGGWDTHQNQGAAAGQLANRLRDFSTAIAAFWQDLGDEAEHTTIVTVSEFGRTARENGTGGTDHGHGNVMFLLGGKVRGGRVYGDFGGLAPEQLHEGRDLPVTTDFRRVLAEAAAKTLGANNLARVFPGAHLDQTQFLGLLA